MGGKGGGDAGPSLIISDSFSHVPSSFHPWLFPLTFNSAWLAGGSEGREETGIGGEMKDVESLLFLKGALTSLRDILLGDWKSEGMSSGLSRVFVSDNRVL